MTKSVWSLRDDDDDSLLPVYGDETTDPRPWLHGLCNTLSKDQFVAVLTTLWAIWWAQRKEIHEQEFQSPLSTHLFTERYLQELRGLPAKKQNNKRTATTSAPRWIPPAIGEMKLNVHGAVAKSSNIGVVGVICRSAQGDFIGPSTMVFHGVTEPAMLEAHACREAIALAEDMVITKVRIASDCLSVSAPTPRRPASLRPVAAPSHVPASPAAPSPAPPAAPRPRPAPPRPSRPALPPRLVAPSLARRAQPRPAAAPSHTPASPAAPRPPRRARGQHRKQSVSSGCPAAPPSPAIQVSPVNWPLGGPAASFLGEEANFDPALAPPPPRPGLFFGLDVRVAFCPVHGYGPCPAHDDAFFCPIHGYMTCPLVPVTPPSEPEVVDASEGYLNLHSPTPSNEDPEHFMPPGYGLVPDLELPPPTEESGALTTATPMVFDLIVKDEPEECI
ncbi:hypothetical protein D1007_51166 [Hordeum vulgare]|nr:hypothetical protein D1007_51166 [Hordeum vulgare]